MSHKWRSVIRCFWHWVVAPYWSGNNLSANSVVVRTIRDVFDVKMSSTSTLAYSGLQTLNGHDSVSVILECNICFFWFKCGYQNICSTKKTKLIFFYYLLVSNFALRRSCSFNNPRLVRFYISKTVGKMVIMSCIIMRISHHRKTK